MNYTKENIIVALKHNDLSQINTMLDSGININDFCIYKNTDVLLISIMKHNVFFLKKILNSNFDFKKNKILYLHHAIRVGNMIIIELLINFYYKNKISLTELDGEKNNILHIAYLNPIHMDNKFSIIALLSKIILPNDYKILMNQKNIYNLKPSDIKLN